MPLVPRRVGYLQRSLLFRQLISDGFIAYPYTINQLARTERFEIPLQLLVRVSTLYRRLRRSLETGLVRLSNNGEYRSCDSPVRGDQPRLCWILPPAREASIVPAIETLRFPATLGHNTTSTAVKHFFSDSHPKKGH